MKYIADLHIHSRYSRATSKDMDIEHLASFARDKGINLLGTGDFTHPDWLAELKRKLKPGREGIYKCQDVEFILTCEVCNIFTFNGVTKKVHNLIFFPSLKDVERLNEELAPFGKLYSDGRPILSLEARKLVEMVDKVSHTGFVVPAHIWTPWFSLFGSKSGFDRIIDCFGDQTAKVFALETGLSSDPGMNWRLSALDRYTLISNSDAHSPSKIGREANIFSEPLDYPGLRQVLMEKDREKFLCTIEFFPEEGKYHFDGHRVCHSSLSPEESKEKNNICPVCGRKVTIGVMHRVVDLADRETGFIPHNAIPYKRLVPLVQIIASVLKKGEISDTVKREYHRIVKDLGSEFAVLLDLSEEKLYSSLSPEMAKAIIKVRKGDLNVIPGYDGEYGKVEISDEEEEPASQPSLF